MFKSSFGYKYAYVPSAKKIKDYERDYESYCRNIFRNEKELQDAVEKEMKDFLICSYVDTSNVNIEQNDIKAGWLRIGSYGMIVSIIFLLLSFSCFVPSYLNKEDQVQRVIIQDDGNSVNKPSIKIELHNVLIDGDGKLKNYNRINDKEGE